MQDTPAELIIRRADAADIPAIIACDIAASQLFRPTGLLSDAALSDHVMPEALGAGIAQDMVHVAELPGAGIAGFIDLRLQDGEIYLAQISVDPALGRRGFGRQLMAQVEVCAHRAGSKSVFLSTFRTLKWNGPFYASLGYREVPRDQYTNFMQALQASEAKFMDVKLRLIMRKSVRIEEIQARLKT